MPASLSIADVIDKNKIASANAWLVLLDIDILDEYGTLVETRRFVKNNEPISFQGHTYEAGDFSLDFKNDTNAEPEFKVNIFDPTSTIRGAMEDYGGGIGFPVTFTVVNSGNLAAKPELQEKFEVIAASGPDLNVSFTLGTDNPLKSEFPYRRQYRDRCPWPYKGIRCGYSGDIGTCDYTLNGTNGCKVHDNVARFGAFPGLRNG